MSNNYSRKRLRAKCPKCDKDVLAWETTYESMGGKKIVHVSYNKHNCKE